MTVAAKVGTGAGAESPLLSDEEPKVGCELAGGSAGVESTGVSTGSSASSGLKGAAPLSGISAKALVPAGGVVGSTGACSVRFGDGVLEGVLLPERDRE